MLLYQRVVILNCRLLFVSGVLARKLGLLIEVLELRYILCLLFVFGNAEKEAIPDCLLPHPGEHVNTPLVLC